MEPVAPTPTIADSAQLAAHVRAALAEHYARPLVVELGAGRVAVLDGKPLNFAREAVTAAHGDAAAALIEPLDVASRPWHAVPADGLRLWRQHGHEGLEGELVTELAGGDPPVQLVVTDDGWQLLRAFDGAQGWVRARDLGAELGSTDLPDAAQLADTSTVDVSRLVDAALQLLEVPYVWGGTTDAGLDCSGIVQRVAWRAGGVWLPRHSRALLRVGARVSPSAVKQPGDIFVLQRKSGPADAAHEAALQARSERERLEQRVPATGPAVHPMHVAIAIGTGRVLHASRDALRVVTEDEATLLERYKVLGVRRLGPTDSSPDAPKDSA